MSQPRARPKPPAPPPAAPARLTAVLLLVLAAAGCTTGRYADPVAVAANRQFETSDRVAAVAQVDFSHAPARARTALGRIVWTERQPMALREAAARRLLADDGPAFKAQVQRHLLDVQRWVMLKFLFTLAAARHWIDWTAITIRSWARRSKIYPDNRRPERVLLEKLYPRQSPRRILTWAFRGKLPGSSLRLEAAAWTVLCRIMPRPKLRAMLATTPPDSLIVRDLQAAAPVLSVLPHNREGILWLIDELGPDRKIFRATAKVIAGLTAAQRRGLAIRHLAALAHLPAVDLALSPTALYARVRARLALHDHQNRAQGNATDDLERLPAQTLAAHREALCWADLVQIDELLNAMTEPALARAVFTQADADRLDKTSEHGGVLAWRNHRVIAQAFAPAIRGLDRRFYASEKLIRYMYSGLAHYHFHAQHYRNGQWAGPGPGDLKFADRLDTGAVVFTFINRRTINVDFYKPGHIVVDLGMLHR